MLGANPKLNVKRRNLHSFGNALILRIRVCAARNTRFSAPSVKRYR